MFRDSCNSGCPHDERHPWQRKKRQITNEKSKNELLSFPVTRVPLRIFHQIILMIVFTEREFLKGL